MLTEEQSKLVLDDVARDLIQQEWTLGAPRSGNNTIYHFCDVCQWRSSYAGCLNYLDAHAEGKGNLRPDCDAAVSNGTCPAQALRKLELKAGRALFYVPYQQLIEERRRRAAAAEEADPLIMFRKNRGESKFIPSVVIPSDDEETPKPTKQKVSKKATPAPAAPVRERDIEVNSNIMEKVLKKRLENE